MFLLSLGSSGVALADRTYTKNADFDEGTLNGLNHDPPNEDQLQISELPKVPPFIWVANYINGTVTKINTDTRKQVAKYHSVLKQNWDGSLPDVEDPNMIGNCNSPSRTTVDGDDNAFVANRGLCLNGSHTRASVTKIAGSLGYCVDRNKNGRIDTSSDLNRDGIIGNEEGKAKEFLGQEDECLLWTKNYAEKGDLGRSIAIDGDQNIWLAGYDSSKLYKLSGKTGEKLLKDPIDLNAERGGGANIYGLAVGPGGFIYTSDVGGRKLRKIDPKASAGKYVVSQVESDVPTYGIAVDRKGIVWLGRWIEYDGGEKKGGVLRVDFTTGMFEKVAVSSSADCQGYTRGVAVDGIGDIWAACYKNHKLLHFKRNPTTDIVSYHASYDTPAGTLGVTIDSHQLPWTSNHDSDTVTRVNPLTGIVESSPAGGNPYSYWDMSGYQYRNSTVRQGEWVVTYDSGKPGTAWGTVHWNREPKGSIPAETSIEVSGQAADDLGALPSQPIFPITRAKSFTADGVTGRYLQLRVVLRTKDLPVSPVLSDLSIIPSWSWGDHPTPMCKGSTPESPLPPGCSVLQYHRSVLLDDGRVFSVGGYTNTSVRFFNPATASWSDAAPMSASRRHHSATLLGSGRVLVTGGVGGRPDGAADLYDPKSNTWTRASSMRKARARHTATLLASGQVLAVGGEGAASTTAELYDPTTNTWVDTGGLNDGRYRHTATLLKDGRVLVAGGFNASGTALASSEVYDPVTASWTRYFLTEARVGHTATLLKDGRVLLTGNGQGVASAASTEIFEPVTNTWSRTASMAYKRSMHAAVLLETGHVLVAGGYHDAAVGILKQAELYDPSTGTWSSLGSMKLPRYELTLTLLPNGEVLAVAGIGTTFSDVSSEVFSP
ncbi:branched-chain amino acid ABC transporter substrate-binding protein [Cystobacter fuscus]|uniref:Branched-chain amino acid ABC transporter substrate-binding protein n=2 Tax=Cystobacter fuscus TaxID=43 RepID=A0A250JLH3_9BACT|nr:branched-chain amino acid ABC transporter substrate-binding protein [Cystobacter fuscus]